MRYLIFLTKNIINTPLTSSSYSNQYYPLKLFLHGNLHVVGLVHHFDAGNYYLLFPTNLYKISNKDYKISYFFRLNRYLI